jgi:hypothetical protein
VSAAIGKNASSASGTGLGRCLGFLPVHASGAKLPHRVKLAELISSYPAESTEEQAMMMMMMMMMNKYQQTA